MTPAAIGPYRVVGPLGSGGMGTVWEVRHPELPGRRLALKLAHDAAPGSRARARFLREAEVLARVQHPGVVGVHASGEAPEGPWLVMDLVEGESLAHLLRRGPLPPSRAAELVAQVAEGVAALHQAGALHRDLKPGNVILRPDGSPVVIDLGLARALDTERLTRTGALVGTPLYMAPEQVDGSSPDRLDARVDVWGLGTLLYVLLQGRAPFADSAGLPDLVRRIRFEEPVWPAAPPRLLAVLRRALAREPGARQPDAAALARDLRRASSAGDDPGPRRARWPLALGALAGLGLAALLVGLARDPGPGPAPPAPVTSAAGPGQAPPPAPAVAPPAPRPRPAPWLALQHPGQPERAAGAFTAGGTRVLTWVPRARAEPDPGSSALVEWDPGWPEPVARWELPGQVELSATAGEAALLLARGELFLCDRRRQEGPVPLRLSPPLDPDEVVTALTLTRDAARLALACGQRGEARTRLRVYELAGDEARLRHERVLPPEDPLASALELSGELLAVGGARFAGVGNTFQVLPLDGGRPVTTLLMIVPVTALARDPAGTLWLAHRDQMIHAVDEPHAVLLRAPAGVAAHRKYLATEVFQSTAASHSAPVSWIRFAPATWPAGPGRILTASSDDERQEFHGRAARELRVWSPDGAGGWRNTSGVGAWPRPLHGLEVSPDGARLLVGHGGQVELWDLAALPALRGDEPRLPEHERVAAALQDGPH